jgi:uncharacterized membrane protein
MKSPRPIHPRQRRWLDDQIPAWVGEGLISGEQAEALKARYESPDDLAGRRSRRIFFVLTGLAVVLASAGLLLVIAHNWDTIGRTTKVAGILTLVAAAFAASAMAYARGRRTGGELLSLVATLMYGNAIWLLAQVFHIRAHDPEGVFWWMLGALAAALLLRSQLQGIQAVILAVIWAGMESGTFDNPAWSFLLWIALAFGLAIHLRAVPLLALACLAFVAWLMLATGGAWHAEPLIFPLVIVAGCALYAGGALAGPIPHLSRSLESLGTLVLLFGLVPLTFTGSHRIWGHSWAGVQPGPVLALGLILLAVVAAGWLLGRRSGRPFPWTVPVLALAGFLPLTLWEGVRSGHPDELGMGLALLYSAASVLASVWLIHKGIVRDEGRIFFVGVVYLLLFVLIRYVDLIGDMLSSAGIFFIAAVILMATARYWTSRRRTHA